MSFINLVFGPCLILIGYLVLKFYKSYSANEKERKENNGFLKSEIENYKNGLEETLHRLEMNRLVAGRFFVGYPLNEMPIEKDPTLLDVNNYVGSYKNIPIFYCAVVNSILLIPQGDSYSHLFVND